MQIKEILRIGEKELNTVKIEESNLKAKLLLSSLLEKNKEYLLMHDNQEVAFEIEEKFFEGIERLKKGEPIQYIIRKQEFYNLDFFVNENVLIPQPDTEILVEEILNIIKEDYKEKDLKILDLCTGSGAIAISIKKNFSSAEVMASDISEKALEVAKINAEKNMVDIKFINSDLFENIDEKFDLIISNPPYIESSVIQTLPEDVKKEPKLALDGGEDGLDFYKKIAKEAKKYLNENGVIAVEIGYNQRKAVIQIFEENNYKQIYSKKDFGGNDRIIVAKF